MSSSESITVNLAQQYDVSNIQSIVIYSPEDGTQVFYDDVLNGCVIELLNEDDIIMYSTPIITQGKRYSRFDGPDISSATFSDSPSTTSIIQPSTSDNIQIWNLLKDSISKPSFPNNLVQSTN